MYPSLRCAPLSQPLSLSLNLSLSQPLSLSLSLCLSLSLTHSLRTVNPWMVVRETSLAWDEFNVTSLREGPTFDLERMAGACLSHIFFRLSFAFLLLSLYM